MAPLITDLQDVVWHLPQAAVLVLDDISWEEYEHILEDLAERPSIRTTYDQGRLEIVTTSPAHERWKVFIEILVSALSEEYGIDTESCGGMTQKRKRDQKGTEADTCFYVANAKVIIGRDDFDLDTAPPPDIVVEVDKANQSLNKFPIYATFGVPEIWRCDVRRKRIEMYALRNNSYVRIESSRFFPILTPAVLLNFIEQCKTQGQIATLTSFRVWLRAQIRGTE
jgi:Uma2 family endonuclease